MGYMTLGVTIFQWMFTLLWFMLPAYIGNIVPLFVRGIPPHTAVDFGKTWKRKRIFGDHKTWRGIVVGILVGGLIAVLQGRPMMHGIVLAAGSFFGDLVGAFIKRRSDIPPGGKSIFIDSLPSPLFALVAALIGGFLTLSFTQTIFVMVSIIPLHLLANKLWHGLKLKSVAW
jgi:CDP-2,3-bis-(O-geranylgeranyl)-sn-glycerol synthase